MATAGATVPASSSPVSPRSFRQAFPLSHNKNLSHMNAPMHTLVAATSRVHPAYPAIDDPLAATSSSDSSFATTNRSFFGRPATLQRYNVASRYGTGPRPDRAGADVETLQAELEAVRRREAELQRELEEARRGV